MNKISEVLTVTYDSEGKDISCLVVAKREYDKFTQTIISEFYDAEADKLYHELLNDEMDNNEKCMAILDHIQKAMELAEEVGNEEIFNLLYETGYKVSNNFIKNYNKSKDFQITDIRDREKLLNDLRPKGEWIMDNEHTKNPLLWYKCNLCGVYHSPTNFCPNCGADMRGGAE